MVRSSVSSALIAFICAAAAPLAAVPDADDSVDLLKVVAVPMAKRFAPVFAAAAVAGVVGFLIGRRGRTSPAWLDAVAVQIGILERAGLAGAPAILVSSIVMAAHLRRACGETKAPHRRGRIR